MLIDVVFMVCGVIMKWCCMFSNASVWDCYSNLDLGCDENVSGVLRNRIPCWNSHDVAAEWPLDIGELARNMLAVAVDNIDFAKAVVAAAVAERGGCLAFVPLPCSF